MKQIMGDSSKEKSYILLQQIIENNKPAVIVTDTDSVDYLIALVKDKKLSQQILITSHDEFISGWIEIEPGVDVYIDELSKLLKVLKKDIKGYTDTIGSSFNIVVSKEYEERWR